MVRSRSILRRALLTACALGSLSSANALAQAEATNLGLATDPLLPARVDGPIALFLASETLQGADLNGDADALDLVPHVFDARRGTTRRLDVRGFPGEVLVRGRIVALQVLEGFEVDVNGDGDMEDAVLHVFDTERRTLRNLRLAMDTLDPLLTDGRRLAFGVVESQQGGIDLNGDGDANDVVLHVLDAQTQRLTNTRLGLLERASVASVDLQGGLLAVQVSELAQGRDLNGDGDSDDEVTHLVDTASDRVTNLRIASRSMQQSFDLRFADLAGGVALVAAQEAAQSRDLNGDGDRGDLVLQLVDIATARVRNVGLDVTSAFPISDGRENVAVFSVNEELQGQDLDGDGALDDVVVHVLDTASGQVRNTGVSGLPLGLFEAGRIVLGVLENGSGDLNGDGDALDLVVHLASARSARVMNTRVAIDTQITFGARSLVDFTVRPGSLFSFLSAESEQGRDLNGDGDLEDSVLHVSDLARGITRNSKLEALLAMRAILAQWLPPSGSLFPIPVQEVLQGGNDLNGDGDFGDVVLHVFDARTGASRNLGLAVPTVFGFSVFPLIAGGAGHVSFPVVESSVDLNGDGDLEDGVLHFVDLATGTVTNVRQAVFPLFVGLPGPFNLLAPVLGGEPAGLGDVYAFSVSEASQGNTDLNGDGDADDVVQHATRLDDRDRDARFDFADDCVRGRGSSCGAPTP